MRIALTAVLGTLLFFAVLCCLSGIADTAPVAETASFIRRSALGGLVAILTLVLLWTV